MLKLIAYDYKYFLDGWNIFDFLIVVGTIISFVISGTTSVSVGPQATIMRTFRIGRILRLIKKAKRLKMIFNSFLMTVPYLVNVGGLLFLLLFLYSILGMFLLATVKLQSGLNVWANFQNFPTAMLTLFRMATGEAWNEIMYDAIRQPSPTFSCESTVNYEVIQQYGGEAPGCGTYFAYPFFLSFQLIVTFIFLNLFIAIILDGFAESKEAEQMVVNQDMMQQFQKLWSKYDPEASGYIKI